MVVYRYITICWPQQEKVFTQLVFFPYLDICVHSTFMHLLSIRFSKLNKLALASHFFSAVITFISIDFKMCPNWIINPPLVPSTRTLSVFSKSIWCRATDQNIEFWIKKMMAAVEIVHVEAPALFPTLPSTQQVFFIRRDVYLLQLAFTLLSYNSTLIIFWQFAYMTV